MFMFSIVIMVMRVEEFLNSGVYWEFKLKYSRLEVWLSWIALLKGIYDKFLTNVFCSIFNSTQLSDCKRMSML